MGERIFLSYGRLDDGDGYTGWLRERLVALGHTVWFDRVDMPSRGQTFHQEVRDAIRAADRVVLLIGPAAMASRHVRAEWQAALIDGTVVTPVLTLGDRSLVPPELAQLHCPELDRARRGDDALRPLLAAIATPIRPPAPLHGDVPALPAHHLPRLDDFSALSSTVLYDVELAVVLDGPQRVTVLHGMPGTGKSVLAAAFTRSFPARRTFGDGIFWLSASPSTLPGELVRSLLRLAGVDAGGDAGGDGLDGGVTALRRWMEARRCLVVVDNAWRVEQIEPLAAALSAVSRMLVTSRDGGLAVALGCNARPLDVLSQVEALEHLAAWVGGDAGELPPDARAVAAECGWLPLALSLQGAMVRGGARWADLLHALRHAELDFAEQRLPGYPHRTVLASLQVSVDVLREGEPAAAARFLELVAFDWRDGVPEDAVTGFWSRASRVPEPHGRKALVVLAQKALVRVDGPPGQRRVRLHDLVIDYLVARGDPAVGNRALVESYRAVSKPDWCDGPDDGYFLDHLLDHLGRLDDGGAEQRRLLFLENADGRLAWFARVDAAGRVERYREQLARLALDEAAGDAGAMRFALLVGSLFACSVNLPAPLLAALIERGGWSVARGRDCARQQPVTSRRSHTPEDGVRMRALLVVAQHLAGGERAAVVDEAWVAARDAESGTAGLDELAGALAAVGRFADALEVARRDSPGDGRTTALMRVAAHATGEERAAIIDEALDECTRTGWVFRGAALAPITPLLDAAGIARARAIAVDPLENVTGRSWCVETLVERLAELDAGAAVVMARSIDDAVARTEALAAAAGRLPAAEQPAVLAEIVPVLRAVDEETWRAGVLAACQELPEALYMVMPMIFAARAWRPAVLARIAPLLAAGELGALTAAVTAPVAVPAGPLPATVDRSLLGGGRVPAAAVAAVAGSLPAADRDALLARTLERIAAVANLEHRASAVVDLAPALDDGRRGASVGAVLEAIAAGATRDAQAALTALAPALTEATVPRFLELTGRIEEPAERMRALAAAVPVLTAGQLAEARAASEAIRDGDEVALAAAALARGAGEGRHRALLAHIAGRGGYVRARALALLAPFLDAALLPELAAVVETIDDAETLATVALPALARRADEPRRTELLRRAITLASSLTDPERRVWAFEGVRDALSPPLVDEAIETFAATVDGMAPEWRAYGRARFLTAVMPHVDETRHDAMRAEALALVPQLDEASLRREILALLPPAPERFEEIVRVAMTEDDLLERAVTLGWLVEDAPPDWRAALAGVVLDDLPEIQQGEDGGERALARVMAYSGDPGYALGLVSRMRDDAWKRNALQEFIRAGDPALRGDVERAIASLDDAGDRATLYAALAAGAAPVARHELLGRAFTAAMSARTDLLHDRVLPPLAASLAGMPAPELQGLLRDHRARLVELERPELLRKLHALAPALLAAMADTAPVVDAILDAQLWWP